MPTAVVAPLAKCSLRCAGETGGAQGVQGVHGNVNGSTRGLQPGASSCSDRPVVCAKASMLSGVLPVRPSTCEHLVLWRRSLHTWPGPNTSIPSRLPSPRPPHLDGDGGSPRPLVGRQGLPPRVASSQRLKLHVGREMSTGRKTSVTNNCYGEWNMSTNDVCSWLLCVKGACCQRRIFTDPRRSVLKTCIRMLSTMLPCPMRVHRGLL